jgi:hypothetical protein
MPSLAPAVIKLSPSYSLPEAILQYEQPSGAFEMLAGGNMDVRIGTEDLVVYANAFDIRSKTAAGNSAGNVLPGATIVPQLLSTATYLVRSRAEYDHHDIASFAVWGQSLPEAQRLGNRQGHFQTARNALLYGFNPANGEGLINTNGAYALNLPADTFGNTTVTTYDNGQMAQFLLQEIVQAKIRMNQLGQANRVVVCAPQRVIGHWEFSIVQVTEAQRPGGGFMTTLGTAEIAAKEAGDQIEWTADDTLIGQGSSGSDLVVISIPEVKKPQGGKINTNEFARLAPGMSATTIMLCDMAAPRELPVPLPAGAIDITFEWRMTSGWAVRPEAITLLSMPFGTGI